MKTGPIAAQSYPRSQPCFRGMLFLFHSIDLGPHADHTLWAENFFQAQPRCAAAIDLNQVIDLKVAAPSKQIDNASDTGR